MTSEHPTGGIRGLSGWLGVVLDCPDPRALGRFYRDLLGWELATEDDDWVDMAMPGHPANLAFQREERYVAPVWPAEPGDTQMMVHLDVGVRGEVADLERAAGEAVALGARLASYQPQDDVRVLLDPVGHPFCLYLDDD